LHRAPFSDFSIDTLWPLTLVDLVVEGTRCGTTVTIVAPNLRPQQRACQNKEAKKTPSKSVFINKIGL
jgi:hypothetical protein